MKTKILLIITAVTFLFTQNVSAQKKKNKDTEVNYLTYFVGCANIPGYEEIVIKTDTVNFDPMRTKTPVLANYEINKGLYVGGYMFNEKGDSTIITDIKTYDSAGVTVFKVIGKDFTRQFTTKSGNGYILSTSSVVSIFYTEGFGIWKIKKRNV